jgi:hypothetical protein
MMRLAPTWREFLASPDQVLAVLAVLLWSALCGLVGYMLGVAK